MALTWHCGRFEELSARTLYQILELRSFVFVVEQRIIYGDVDGLDYEARHMWVADGAHVAAYLRILPAGARYAETSMGRVVVDSRYRGTGLGKGLVRRALAVAGAGPVRITAQAYLERFYGELGFERASQPYDEYGIRHVEMLRPGSLSTSMTTVAR